MNPLAAFGLGGLTACILMRIAISISHRAAEHQPGHHDHHDHHRKERP